jgi:hypothetical protein
MPDLKSELSKVLDEWSKPETTMTQTKPATPYFTTTNNVCRATFDCIKNNPGKSRQELAALLGKEGYKKSSTTSLMGQMIKQNMVRDTGGGLFAVVPEYTPIKSYKAFANQQAQTPQRKVVTITNTRTGKVINPKPAPVAAPVAAPVEKEWEPKDVIDTLTVRQALALFKELRNLLVG